MTSPRSKPPEATVRTPEQIRAEATALAGRPSLVATAATTTDDPPPAPADQGTVGEIWLYGVVGGYWWGFDAESVANAIRGMDVDTLYVRIHSPGGIASEGIAIGNLLRNHAANVVVVVDGMAASAASVIAIAGDEVIMCPGSQMMLHDASTGTCVWGNAAELREAAAEITKAADWIDGVSQNYAGVYAYRAGKDAAYWRQVMLANGTFGTWYTADEAVAAGLADAVGTRPAVGSPPVAPADELGDELDAEDLAKVAHDLQVLEQCVSAAARAAWNGERPKPPTASAGGTPPPKEGSTPVTRISDAGATTIGQKLGIAEDADEATILAALDEALDERTEPTAQVPEGHVVIPAAKLADLEAGATAGAKAAKQLHDSSREAFLDANRAKYAATNRDAWAKEYDRDPEGTRKHFAEAPDLVPVSEHGHSVDSDDAVEDQGTALDSVRESEAYKNWSFS